jgi:lysophospholipase
MAHSYGGLITVHGSMERAFDGIILSSPFFGFAMKVPAWKALAGRLLSRYVPGLAMPTDIDSNIVSHDPATREEYATDPLIGQVATARWLTETEKAHETLPAAAGSLSVPVLLQQAGDDKLVDANAGRTFFDSFPSDDKEWVLYDELYHEIWFELDRQTPINHALKWLKARTQGV